MSWPKHAFNDPIQIPINNVIGELYVSGIGWCNDLPSEAEKRGFTHIINCAGWFLRNSHYKTHPNEYKLTYYEINLNDSPDENLSMYLNEIYKIIDDNLNKKSKILIHCFFGQSRSISFIIFYLMKKFSWSYDQSLNYIKIYRKEAMPNDGYVKHLKEFKL